MQETFIFLLLVHLRSLLDLLSDVFSKKELHCENRNSKKMQELNCQLTTHICLDLCLNLRFAFCALGNSNNTLIIQFLMGRYVFTLSVKLRKSFLSGNYMIFHFISQRM